MTPYRLVSGHALALGLSIVVFIPATPSEAAIVVSGDITPTYDDSDPWEVGGNLVVGYNAPATLQVDAASVVNSASGILAAYDSSSGEVTVSGSGSAWNNSGALLVGRAGTGTLNIENGGTVTNQSYGYLGLGETTTGTVNVTGAGSVWNNQSELHIGRFGSGILNVENGATVSNVSEGYLGYAIGSTGTVNVTGPGSVWDALDALYVGNIGDGVLNIQNGASVSNTGESRIGRYTGSTGIVTVTGTGSVWDIADRLFIGSLGAGTLNIENGATVNSGGTSYIGFSIGVTNTVTVTGAGSEWNLATFLDVGSLGEGTLNILDGGVVETRGSSSSDIGVGSGSHGTVNVDDSRLSILFEDLNVGYHGTGELNISNGGRVSNIEGRIGYQPTGVGTARVGGGSVWELSEALFVGYEGRGTLFIEAGGQIESAAGVLGHRAGSVGMATVTGAGSIWNCRFGMRVGQYTGQCTLLIENGGVVNAPNSVIGYDSGLDNTATVTGVGSVWNCSDLLTVGLKGQGTLTIDDGATVSVGNQLTLGEETEGIGVVNLAGGTLDLNGGELAAGLGDATFNFTGGTLKNAGSIQLGQPFVQDGGTLAPGGSIGQMGIEGNYDLNAGTLEVELGGMGNPIDLVTVTSDIDIANTDTTLDLQALGPMAAGTYTVLESTAGTITGMFENVSALNLFGVNVTVNNTGNAITVTLDSDLVFADPNLDGFVGIDDLDIVLNHWNQTVTAGDILSGDLDGDGFVGLNDLDAVLNNWNAGTLPPETANVIPEPSSVGLMLLSVFGICRRGWTRAA